MIGERVQAAREAKGFSRRELAERIGVHPSMIEGIENNRWKPGLDTFARLVQELDLSCQELLGALIVDQSTPEVTP